MQQLWTHDAPLTPSQHQVWTCAVKTGRRITPHLRVGGLCQVGCMYFWHMLTKRLMLSKEAGRLLTWSLSVVGSTLLKSTHLFMSQRVLSSKVFKLKCRQKKRKCIKLRAAGFCIFMTKEKCINMKNAFYFISFIFLLYPNN